MPTPDSTADSRRIAVERARAWQLANPERYAAYRTKYKAANIDRIRARAAAYRARPGFAAKNRRNQRAFNARNPWHSHWRSAKNRATNPACPAYRYYGARGITFHLSVEDVRDLWFRDHADRLQQPSIDRIDSDGPYSPQNCRFVELSENSRDGIRRAHAGRAARRAARNAQLAAEWQRTKSARLAERADKRSKLHAEADSTK